jgi:hypothetical protein
MTNAQSDTEFVFCELENKFVDDPTLRSLCFENSELFFPDTAASAPTVSNKIILALRQGRPFSLLRVGNGEGNAMQMAKGECCTLQISTFYHEFLSQNWLPVAQDQAMSLCKQVRASLISADIIGFRAFRFDERAMIYQHTEQKNFYAALGILYAREFLSEGLIGGYWRGSIITGAWIHLDMIAYLDAILTAAHSVIVVSGRSELEEAFRRRLGEKLEAFIIVPVQGFVPPSLDESHFAAFPSIKERLNRDLRGKLVLVGAGLFGKVYCHVAKTNGAVAIDLGSVFDVLAGLETRPIHKHYDINSTRWI